MTEDAEEPPGPVTLGDAVLRTPLHRLPAGFKWGFWVLGGAVGSLPVLVPILNHEPIRMDNLMASACVSGILCAFYLLVVLGGHPRYRRWVGVVCTGVIGFMILAVFLGSFSSHRYASRRASQVSCMNNLKQVGVALYLYSNREGCYPELTGPAFLGRLYQAGDLPDLRCFLCRESGCKVTTNFATDFMVNPAVAGAKGDVAPNPSAFPTVWESQPFHFNGQARCVLFMDGSVRSMQEADFQAMLAKGTK